MRDDFRLYDPLGIDSRQPHEPETVSSDLMMRIILALLFVCGLVAVLMQQRQGVMMENEQLRQTVSQQQQIIDSVPVQIAEELKKVMREAGPTQPVVVEKPKATVKPKYVKKRKSRLNSATTDLHAKPIFRMEKISTGGNDHD